MFYFNNSCKICIPLSDLAWLVLIWLYEYFKKKCALFLMLFCSVHLTMTDPGSAGLELDPRIDSRSSDPAASQSQL